MPEPEPGTFRLLDECLTDCAPQRFLKIKIHTYICFAYQDIALFLNMVYYLNNNNNSSFYIIYSRIINFFISMIYIF